MLHVLIFILVFLVYEFNQTSESTSPLASIKLLIDSVSPIEKENMGTVNSTLSPAPLYSASQPSF